MRLSLTNLCDWAWPLLQNIRLVCKCLPCLNTLAYYAETRITFAKKVLLHQLLECFVFLNSLDARLVFLISWDLIISCKKSSEAGKASFEWNAREKTKNCFQLRWNISTFFLCQEFASVGLFTIGLWLCPPLSLERVFFSSKLWL